MQRMKKKLESDNIKDIINDLRDNRISGINVTVPFKNIIISHLDELSDVAKETQSVNTIFKKNNKVIGENTDVFGFSESIRQTNFNLKIKKH